MAPHPETIIYQSEVRRQGFLDQAATSRLVKQATTNAYRPARSGGSAHAASTVLAALRAVAVRLHAKPAALAPSHR